MRARVKPAGIVPLMRRLLALGLAAGLCACERTPAAPKVARHVVLVTIDTLARRPPGLLRLARRGDAAARPDRRPGRPGRGGLGPRPAHAPVARLALHGPPAQRARHPRQRLAGGGAPGTAAGRALPQGRLRDRGLRLVGRARVAVRPRPRLRRLRRPLRGSGRRRAVPEHGPEEGRGHDRGGRRVAARAVRPPRVPVAAPLRAARPLRAAGAVRLALRGPSLRRRGGLGRRALRPLRGRASPRSGSATTRRSSSPPTTARAWASTTRRCTASSPTRRRCASRSWCGPPESRRAAASSARCGSSTSSPPSSSSRASRRPRGSRSPAAAWPRRCAAGRSPTSRRPMPRRSCRCCSSAGATCA